MRDKKNGLVDDLNDLKAFADAMSPGELIMISGASGTGKTTLALRIAQALVGFPELLILDEPCMNLGLAAAKKLCATVAAYLKKNPKMTAICIAHRPEHVPAGFDHELNLDTRKD